MSEYGGYGSYGGSSVGPAYPYAASPAPVQRKSRGRRVLIVVSSIVSFVVAGALASYVVPRALGDVTVPADAKPEVTVTLPTHLHGWTKMEGKAETQMIKQVIGELPDQVHARGAVYGRAGDYQAVILVEPRRLNLFQQKALLQQDARQMKGLKVTTRAVPPGPLGGLMQCGRSADKAQTYCSFADDGLYAYVAFLGQPKDYLATLHAVRAAIEHRVG